MFFKNDFLLILILGLTSCVAAQHLEEILRNDFETPDHEGRYRWAFRTEGGIYHEQKGSPSTTTTGEPSVLVEGQYQYTAPDGQVINVLYKADENGFHATGDHLPTPPPIPPAIQRALDYIASLQRTEDNLL